MLATMADRPRLIIDCPNTVRRAAKLRAAKEDSSVSEVVMAALRSYLAAEIVEAEKHIERERQKKRDKS